MNHFFIWISFPVAILEKYAGVARNMVQIYIENWITSFDNYTIQQHLQNMEIVNFEFHFENTVHLLSY